MGWMGTMSYEQLDEIVKWAETAVALAASEERSTWLRRIVRRLRLLCGTPKKRAKPLRDAGRPLSRP